MEIRDTEMFHKLVAELDGYTLIVEGRKDMQALKALGLKKIIPLNGKPLADFVSGLDGDSEFVVLTDFDSEGKRIAARLLGLMQRVRIKANPRLRHMLMLETGISRVEELLDAGIALTKEKGDCHGEIGADFHEVCGKSKYKGKRHC